MTTPAISANEPDDLPAKLDPRRLLLLYLVVPLCLFLMAIDLVFLHGHVRSALPKSTDRLFLFTAVFNFPHIVASYFLYFDDEYLKLYGRRIVLSAAAIALFTPAVLIPLGVETLLLLTLLWTNFHILQQQLRLLAVQLRTNDWALPAYGWISQLISGLLLFGVADQTAHGLHVRPLVFLMSLLLLLPSTYLTVRLGRRSLTPSGRHYLWANQSLMVSLALSFVLGYPLLAILMTRVVHDLTAFYGYAVHDTNRNHPEPRNRLYRAISVFGVPPAIAGPALAIALAYLVQSLMAERVAAWVVYFLSVLHYYLESFVWEPGTVHRRHAPLR